jgi:hypothetical protein
MSTRLGLWRILGLVLILLALLGCASLGSIQPTNTPVSPGSGSGNSSGDGSGTGSGDSNNNPNPNNPISISTLQATSTPEATPTDLTDIFPGPYTVRQTMTLGKEKLGTPAGGVCVNAAWQVPVDTPQVSFAFVFGPYSVPPGSTGNTFGYAYNIPSAGESHEAQGSYTLSPNKDRSMKVSLTARDHVVFKGFDGVMPVQYSFDLVPIGGDATCN